MLGCFLKNFGILIITRIYEEEKALENRNMEYTRNSNKTNGNTDIGRLDVDITVTRDKEKRPRIGNNQKIYIYGVVFPKHKRAVQQEYQY